MSASVQRVANASEPLSGVLKALQHACTDFESSRYDAALTAAKLTLGRIGDALLRYSTGCPFRFSMDTIPNETTEAEPNDDLHFFHGGDFHGHRPRHAREAFLDSYRVVPVAAASDRKAVECCLASPKSCSAF